MDMVPYFKEQRQRHNNSAIMKGYGIIVIIQSYTFPVGFGLTPSLQEWSHECMPRTVSEFNFTAEVQISGGRWSCPLERDRAFTEMRHISISPRERSAGTTCQTPLPPALLQRPMR